MSFMPGRGRGRVGYAPRRGRGGRTRPYVKHQDSTKPDLTKRPLGELLVSLKNLDLEPLQTDLLHSSRILDCQYVTSYNWLADKAPTIMIPGRSLFPFIFRHDC
jgi:hypothetical protein